MLFNVQEHDGFCIQTICSLCFELLQSLCSCCLVLLSFCVRIVSFSIGFVASALAFLAFVLVFGCQGAQDSQRGPSNTIRFLRFKLLHSLCNSSIGRLAYVLVCQLLYWIFELLYSVV